MPSSTLEIGGNSSNYGSHETMAGKMYSGGNSSGSVGSDLLRSSIPLSNTTPKENVLWWYCCVKMCASIDSSITK